MNDFSKKLYEIADIVGEEFVKTGPDGPARFRVDDLEPRAVVFPGDTRQVSDLVGFACRENLALVPWGGGTKIGMGNPPRRLDLVVCSSRMNHITDLDTANLTITVEAGVKFRDLQATLASRDDRCYLPLQAVSTPDTVRSKRSGSGCFLPIDPSHAGSATMGGIIATASGGPRRLLYRLPRDSILGVRLVSPDGNVCGAGGKTMKNVSGYDISKLAVGSMGSLGIICEITLKLLPLPERMETLIYPFKSFAQAAGFADQVLESNLLPAAVEVMDRRHVEFVCKKMPVPSDRYVSAVALEHFAPAVDRMKREILETAKRNGAGRETVLDEEDHRIFWLALSDIEQDMIEVSPGLIKAKLNYPLSRWHGVINSIEAAFSGPGPDYSFQTHAGSGICHVFLFLERGDDPSVSKAVEGLNGLLTRCRELGGNLVIHRAPPAVKKVLKVWGEPGSDLTVMRRLKMQIDPSGILSPGRYVGGL